MLLPALRRTGFRWKFRLDLRGSRLGEAGPLALWVIGYVVVSQIGYLVQLRLANGVPDDLPGVATFTNASLLFQMPYGILGVSLLTALMPRMSRAAARGDRDGLLSDLSLGSRLSALALLPVTALFIVLGPAIGTVIYGHGRTDVSASPHDRRGARGLRVRAGAVRDHDAAAAGVLRGEGRPHPDHDQPRHDGREGGVCRWSRRSVLADRNLVAGLLVATSLSYVVGAIAGEVLLRRRFGRLDTARTIRASVRFLVMSMLAGLAAWAVLVLVTNALGRASSARWSRSCSARSRPAACSCSAPCSAGPPSSTCCVALRGRPPRETSGRRRAGRE